MQVQDSCGIAGRPIVTEFPEGTRVEARYPRSKQEEHGDRAAWPWLPGVIEEVCGPDEWLITVTAPELATLEDGSPAPAGTDPDEVWHPQCFRDASEIREAA
jgi:hypothetical protein